MIQSRCVRSMHLDMNNPHCGFEFFRPIAPGAEPPPLPRRPRRGSEYDGRFERTEGWRLRARRGVRSMGMPFPRYSGRDGRDFFYLLLRPTLPGPHLTVEGGARLVGIGEWDGTIHAPDGLDPGKVKEYQRRKGTVLGYPGAKSVKRPQACLTIPCDILIPAALENQITTANAERLRCRIVAEGANGPTTPGAERILQRRGVTVLPDIYLNAGGVTVSYFEWVQNKTSTAWDIERIDADLNKHMVLAARRTLLAKHRYECDLRTAAYIAALENIGKVYSLRGIFP